MYACTFISNARTAFKQPPLSHSQTEDNDLFPADHCSCYARCFRHPEINTAVIHNVTSRGGSLSSARPRTILIEKRFDPRIHILHFPSAVQGKNRSKGQYHGYKCIEGKGHMGRVSEGELARQFQISFHHTRSFLTRRIVPSLYMAPVHLI